MLTSRGVLYSRGESYDENRYYSDPGDWPGLAWSHRREFLDRTDRATYCPYKGDCSYFSIPLGGERSINAVWSYEAPYAAVMPIKDYLAFYPERVDAIEERPEA